MRVLLSLALLLSASSFCFSQDPFDRYISSVKKGNVDSDFARFAKDCGVSATALPLYGVAVGGVWKVVRDLPKGVRDTESDFFESAEVSKASVGPRALSLWSIDSTAGYEQNTFFCFDRNGHVRYLSAKTFSMPVDGQGSSWRYKERRTFDGHGQLIAKKGNFFDKMGSPIPKPQLDENEAKWIEFVPGNGNLDELKLPAELR